MDMLHALNEFKAAYRLLSSLARRTTARRTTCPETHNFACWIHIPRGQNPSPSNKVNQYQVDRPEAGHTSPAR